MSRSTPRRTHDLPKVHIIRLGGPTPLARVRHATRRPASGERAYLWVVGSLMLAATGLALYDLYQLVTLTAS